MKGEINKEAFWFSIEGERKEKGERVRLKSKWIFLRLRSHFQEQHQHDNFLPAPFTFFPNLKTFLSFFCFFPRQHNTTLAFLCLFPYACFIGMLNCFWKHIWKKKEREKERISPRKKERGSPSYSGSWFSFPLFFFFCRGFSFGLALSLENSRVSYQLFPHPLLFIIHWIFHLYIGIIHTPHIRKVLCIYIFIFIIEYRESEGESIR